MEIIKNTLVASLLSFLFVACQINETVDVNNSFENNTSITKTISISSNNNTTLEDDTSFFNDENSSYNSETNKSINSINNSLSKKVTIIPYFSKTSGAYYKDGVDIKIIEDINNSKKSIHLALYELTNKYIAKALIDAFNRGVEIKVFTDDQTRATEYEYFDELEEAGIPIEDDQNRYALMHNKFLIIDSNVTWTGSANYTVYAFYRNYENLVKVKNTEVAAIYNQKFDYLYNHVDVTMPPSKVENVEIYFSPDDDFEEKIIELIDNSKKTIYFLAFAFTNDKIAEALVRAKERGVVVKGVFDEGQNEYQSGSDYQYLLDNGLDVKLDGSKYKLHSKIFIFDENTTITGSYNFTIKANDKNDENSLVIYDKNLTSAYVDNFNTIYSEAK